MIEPAALADHKPLQKFSWGVKLLNALWAALRRPWLLIASGVAVVLLVLSAQALPQLPGQLHSDAAEAARWLQGASTPYGVAGDILVALGLFNVLHSFLLQLLLVIISLILFVHLGDLLAGLWLHRRLPHLVQQPATSPGEPLTLPSPQSLYRLRQANTLDMESLAAHVQSALAERFAQVLQTTPLTTPAPNEADLAQPGEVRLLATRHTVWSYLRPLLMFGLLVALAAVWTIVTTGWELAPVALAPGESYRYPPHGLEFVYQVEEGAGEMTPLLVAQIKGAQNTVVAKTPLETTLAGVALRVQPGPPALLISTVDGAQALTRAGQSDTASSLGLAFPSPGSEEAVVLPEQAVGLRIVRMADDAVPEGDHAFLLEVYQGENAQPAQRLTIGGKPMEIIQLDDEGLSLRVMELYGLEVSARYLPGVWLLWLAGVLVLVGAAGFWFRPAFMLAQVAPWPPDRAVIVAQSDAHVEIATLCQRLTSTEGSESL